ncbi:MAG TPA: hypothetical protein VLS89_14640 [Candidatus Nanopelagicales bacterium]|nr:hypothetical protein [Candidatus Nanopelagicales bacterium]
MIWRKLMALGTIGLGAAIAASACTVGVEPGDEDPAMVDEDIGTDTAEIRGRFCGGLAGIQCPAGLMCIDDPRDDCDPEAGGADCGGICRPDRPEPPPACLRRDPTKDYISQSPEQCAAIRFFCKEEHAVPFFDECGCGCQTAPAGEVCGRSVCGPDQYCCNESCGICAPKGGFCTQQFCGDVAE